MRNDHNSQLGREIEKRVSAWLKTRGFLILPAYDYSGRDDNKAPTLQGLFGNVITPDILAVHQREGMRWVEVKYKTQADFTRMTSRWETGVDLVNWEHYQRVAQVTQLPVWIVFVHGKEQEVRGGETRTLAREARFYRGGRLGKGGMVFFAWDRLTRFGSFDAIIGGGLEELMLPGEAGAFAREAARESKPRSPQQLALFGEPRLPGCSR